MEGAPAPQCAAAPACPTRSGLVRIGIRLRRSRSLHVLALGLVLAGLSIVSADGQGPVILRRRPNVSLRLPPRLDDPGLLPPTLADTGAFGDLIRMTPEAGIVPYEPNVPLWSDGAHKARWFSVPDTNLTIGFQREANWSFPAGTVWIKQFDLPLSDAPVPKTRRLETRFLVRTTEGAYGVTYRWDDSQTNATLVAAEGLDEDVEVQVSGRTETQVWHYPSRGECMHCHVRVAGWSLGFNTPQINRDFEYGGIVTNQIAALELAGYLSGDLSARHTLRALAPATNLLWSLEYRVRSYLAANCVQCHQPGGAGPTWDARITTPTALAGIINGPAVFRTVPDGRIIAPGSLARSLLFLRIRDLGAAHMPPLATGVVNREAVNLLSEWITSGLAGFRSFAEWQTDYFGSTEAPEAAPDADPDRDGVVNGAEYLLGTNPLFPGDPSTVVLEPGGASVRIRFRRPANRYCELQSATRLDDETGWVAVDSPVNQPMFRSSDSLVVFEAPAMSSSATFYRVRIHAP